MILKESAIPHDRSSKVPLYPLSALDVFSDPVVIRARLDQVLGLPQAALLVNEFVVEMFEFQQQLRVNTLIMRS